MVTKNALKMNFKIIYGYLLLTLFLTSLLIACEYAKKSALPIDAPSVENSAMSAPDSIVNLVRKQVIVPADVLMSRYFEFIDSISEHELILPEHNLGEYILVNYNSWIIDSLRALDYYYQKNKGVFQFDLSHAIILHKGDTIIIPDSAVITSLIRTLKSSRIDVNLPEYRLRVIQKNDTVLNCPVRIGKNDSAYLETLGKIVNQRTPVGNGKIVNVLRRPIFYDLHTGEKYLETKRDDNRNTIMPEIPSLEPEIEGVRVGKMFHATTNLKTLGKAYSNGCIGLREADMWSLYYYAPAGTLVELRYDLMIVNEYKDTIHLKDIYHLQIQRKEP
jgi:L,D-transpeptidase ErfK/SrfK